MKKLIFAFLFMLIAPAFALAGDDPLAAGFHVPPDSAKPQTWWHWMNGNITKEGITADLEAMKRVGVGGAEIFIVDCNIPAGPVKFMSPEFREMMKHAISEADRLHLDICLHNGAGWSSSGGPWNTPEHAMQTVTTSETKVKGPSDFADVLPKPNSNLDFYKDISVLAYPTPSASDSLASHHPAITSSGENFEGAALIDEKNDTEIALAVPRPDKAQFIQFAFEKPLAIRSVSIKPGKGIPECGGAVQVSDDGNTFTEIRKFECDRGERGPIAISTGERPVSSRFFRVVFDHAAERARRIPIAEIELSQQIVIENLQNKAAIDQDEVHGETDVVNPDQAIPQNAIVDLTSKMDADGRLKWQVPEGNWTILRIGHTAINITNHPAPKEGTGLECDKLSKEALDAHWAGYMQKVIDDVGPLAGKYFNNSLIDSYEVGNQNWTPKMKEEFQRLRGYDMTPFLPVISGHVVGNPEVSERFLWDLRRTVADLFAENYFAHFGDLCHKAGLKMSTEPYTGPFESMQCGKPADIVMGEFWTGSQGDESVKLAASIAHVYGRKLVGAESFTSAPGAHGRWQEDPHSLKALGDLMYCRGINRYIFHRYAQQPWLDRYPGMTMGPWGFHFDRTNTWFEKSTTWLQYITRCQYLLQQGLMVADVAAFCGESAPVETNTGDLLMPPGYDYDSINADAILTRASVKDGRIVLPDGMSYAVLALPAKDTLMTPVLLQKIHDLVNDGATVVGPKPVRSPSLQDFPQSDEKVKMLADEVWGNADGQKVFEHKFGKGRAVWGKSLAEVFAGNIKPDFDLPADSRARLAYIHRVNGDTDFYFVSNQRETFTQVNCTFRVTGKVPELWHPDTGMIETAPIYSDVDGRTTLPLQLDPVGSVFVVFRKTDAPAEHFASISPADAPTTVPQPKLDITSAVYEAVDGGGSMDVKNEFCALVASGIDSIDVSNGRFGQDPAPNHVKQLRVKFVLNNEPREVITPEGKPFEVLVITDNYAPCAYELHRASDGKPELLAWQAGKYDVKDGRGQTHRIEVAKVAEPEVLNGPWELYFPPKWGAPEMVTLNKLISWTDHEDKGVKYFSGTATYKKELEISQETMAGDQSVYLDLGRVKNLAQVKVNGKDLGILWKPPFRLDLRKYVTVGTNRLEISVTNLWPNRLIGDEQIGQDAEWKGQELARWPQWLLDGKPSPSGRVTFTTWHHWTKDMNPLESGLLGPVTIQLVEPVLLK